LRLCQVLLNLLSNAVKFTDHGQVSLKVSKTEPSRIRFEVRDSGIGIAESHWESIFQPFEQVNDINHIVKGTGLGLAISRKLLQMMGGNIEIQSWPGEGSLFAFELKLDEMYSGQEVQPQKVAVDQQVMPPLFAPPEKEILILHDFARQRNMQNIEERAAFLVEVDKRYFPFVNKLKGIVKSNHLKTVFNFLELYMKKKPEISRSQTK
jgi:hypothetical protein